MIHAPVPGGGTISNPHATQPARVHFHPVVSQLRYREAQGCLRPMKGRVDGEDKHSEIKMLQTSENNCRNQHSSPANPPSKLSSWTEQKDFGEGHCELNQNAERVRVQFHNVIPPRLEKIPSFPTTHHNTVVQQNIFVTQSCGNRNLELGLYDQTMSHTLPTSQCHYVNQIQSSHSLLVHGFPPGGPPPSNFLDQSHIHTYSNGVPESYPDPYHHHLYQNLPGLHEEIWDLRQKEAENRVFNGGNKRLEDAMPANGPLSNVGGSAGVFESKTLPKCGAVENSRRLHSTAVANGQQSGACATASATCIINNGCSDNYINNKCDNCKIKNKSSSKLSKFNFLQWITLGRLGGGGQSGRKVEKELSDNKSSMKSNGVNSSKKASNKKFKRKTSESCLQKNQNGVNKPVPVSTWPVKSNTNFLLAETIDQPNSNQLCVPCPSAKGDDFNGHKSKKGRKSIGSLIYPSVVGIGGGEGQEISGRINRENVSCSETISSENNIGGGWMKKSDGYDDNECEDGINTSILPPIAERKRSNLLQDVHQANIHHVYMNTWDRKQAPGSFPTHAARTLPARRLNPADSEVIRSQITPSEGVRTTGKEKDHLGQGNEKITSTTSRNASTSPIQHLSTFYALNIPVVSPRSVLETEKEDKENLASPTSVPVAKPRSNKAQRNISSSSKPPSASSIKAETDELSANVEKILDEIAGLELECLKMDLVDNRNVMDSTVQPSSAYHEQHVLQIQDRKQSKNQCPAETQSESEDWFGRSSCEENYETQEEENMECVQQVEEPVPVIGKPPLPPVRGNIAGTREEFFSDRKGTRGNAGMEQVVGRSRGNDFMRKPGGELDVKLLKFRQQLCRSREELAKSHPNLDEIEETVRSSVVIDRSDTRGKRASTTRTAHPNTPRTHYSGGVVSCGGEDHGKRWTTTTRLGAGEASTNPTRTSTTQKVSGCKLSLTPDPVTLEKERKITQEWNHLYRQGSEKYSRPIRNPEGKYYPVNSAHLNYNNQHGNNSSESIRLNIAGIIETDLDAGTGEDGDLGYLHPEDDVCGFRWSGEASDDNVFDEEGYPGCGIRSNCKKLPLSIFKDGDGILTNSLNSKTKSLVNLGSAPISTIIRDGNIESSTLSSRRSENTGKMAESSALLSVGANSQDERARSMEFLLDDSDKNAHLLPPENNLMQRGGENRQLSEHELRIQRSLNKLNVPDWYKSYGRSGSASGGVTPTSGMPGSHGGRSHFNRIRSSGTQSSGARSSRESLMSPSSTASASPSPYYERSSFTYGMPYALTRFATSRMSCGASPASLSPSPSPVGGVGSSTSTPVTSAPLSRHHSYSKAPYLGWRSQERLASKTLYRTPAERLAADIHAQKQKASGSQTPSAGSGTTTPSTEATTEKKMELTETETSKAETVSASDLSLNNSEESSSKLNRVRSSIKEVSNAIVDYVNESKPLDDSVNGGVSPRKGYVWLETAFVGTKPIDSPGTPDTPSVMVSNNRHETTATSASTGNGKAKNVFQFEEETVLTTGQHGLAAHRMRSEEDSYSSAANNGSATVYNPYSSRNEQMEERSNSSSVSSPTLEDILDSLLALRRPNKKTRARSNKGHSKDQGQAPPLPPPRTKEASPISDWQERMNQPLDDTAYFPTTDEEFFSTSKKSALSTTFFNSSQEFPDGAGSGGIVPSAAPEAINPTNDSNNDNSYGFQTYPTQRNEESDRYRIENNSNEKRAFDSPTGSTPRLETALSYELGVSSREYEASGNEGDDVDENAFGTPTEIHAGGCSAAVNALASLNDSNPSTPARHRRVSFDLDISDKDEKSSSRSKKDESVGGSIHCRNSKCGKNATGLEARREFKTCHNCNAYYCSRECRRAHWEKHKKVCMQSRVGALCKQIINHVKEDSYVVQQLSGVARRGVLAKGRGCVKLFFSSPDRAERFLTGGLPELPEPWYIPSGDILPEEMGAQTFSELSEQCRTYNGENRFVLYVSVCVVNEVPTSGAVKWEREMISRSAKLRLVMPRNYEEAQMHHQAASPAHLFPDEPVVVPPPVPPRDHTRRQSLNENSDIPRPTVSPPPPPLPPHSSSSSSAPVDSEDDTLILKSVPPPTFHTLSGNETRKLREVSFANIQRHLIGRGVDLRQTYPEIYTKLCNYVENDETFLPVTIYPKNNTTGRHFMCVIMPDCTTASDTTIDELPNPLTGIATGSRQVETINISESPSPGFEHHLR